MERYVRILAAMSALAAAAAYFLAPFVLRLLYGDVYASGPWSAIGAFRWLALAYLFAMVTPVLVVGEMLRANARALLFAALASLAVNVAANAWAIPRFGAQGSAAALALSEAAMFLVLFARCTARGDVRFGRLLRVQSSAQ
jgi:O-antigen/teichoic acid export membrane protein